MPTELYGDTQVREVRFTKAEMISIVLRHVSLTMDKPYDFDYSRPIVIQDDDGGLILRYVQQTIAVDRESRQVTFKSIDSMIEHKAEEKARRIANNAALSAKPTTEEKEKEA